MKGRGMKRTILAVISTVLILALVFVIYRTFIYKLPIEEVIPAGPIFYMRVCDVEKNFEKFKVAQLWGNIKNIKVELLMKESGATEEQISQYKKLKTKLSRFTSGFLLNEFFGNEVALAIYPTNMEELNANTLLNIASDFILVTRIKTRAEFIEFISTLSSKFGNKIVNTKFEKYNGYEIAIIDLSDELSISYIKVKDLLVIGLGKKAVYACLNVVTKKSVPLSQDKDYKSAIRDLPKKTQVISYQNFSLLYSGLKQFLDLAVQNNMIPSQKQVQITEDLNKLSGFKTAVYVSEAGEVIKNKLVFTFDKYRIDPIFMKTYSVRPQENRTLKFVPKNIIGYHWTNCFDAEFSWDQFMLNLPKMPEQESKGPAVASIITNIENRLGINIEQEVIPWLGNEIGIFLADIETGSIFPIPKILFFVKINDPAGAENIMQALAKKNDIPMQSEDYKGKTIKYVFLPFAASLQPGYCLLDDYLLISSTRQLLRETIATSVNEDLSLVKNEEFNAVDFGLTGENNAITFIDTDLLLTKMQAIGEWIIGWMPLITANYEMQQKKLKQNLYELELAIQKEESQLKYLRSQAPPEETELATLQAEIKAREQETNLAKKDLQERRQIYEQMCEKSPKKRLRLIGLYLTEAVFPILEGLKINKATGSRTIFGENHIQIHSFCKTVE